MFAQTVILTSQRYEENVQYVDIGDNFLIIER